MQKRSEKVIVITKKTELEELIERFNTESQARFYLEHSGQDFDPILSRHNGYSQTLKSVLSSIPRDLKYQTVERKFLPQYKFEPSDLIVVIGPDGLVVNAAKYLDGQPIIALNPDPNTIDGVLLPFDRESFYDGFQSALSEKESVSAITLAEAILSNGQRLLAFNDFFIGAKTHASARYEIEHNKKKEFHSSSGIIVSTGAGSTGWMRSVYTGALAVSQANGAEIKPLKNNGRLPWDTNELLFAVREPFPSKATGTSIVFGKIESDKPLIIKSHMPQHGVVFSDGVEADFISFNSGETATIRVSQKQATLVKQG